MFHMNVSTKYNTIHSTVVVLSHSICVWLWDYQQILLVINGNLVMRVLLLVKKILV